MLTEREKSILRNLSYTTDIDFIIDNFSDEELKEDLDLFVRFDSFNSSEKIVDLLMGLSTEELKKVYPEMMYIIPKKMKYNQLISLIDKGLNVSSYNFTRKFLYYVTRDRDTLMKYKHLIDVGTIIREKIRAYNNEILLECCYDELIEVSTETILDNLNLRLTDDDMYPDNLELGLLVDKLKQLQKREFKDDDIIKSLLKVIADHVKINNGCICKDFLKYFDDDYIIKNIELFDPIQLYDAGRLTEDIYQKILDNNNLYGRYGHYLQQNCMHELSLDFIVRNTHNLNSYYFAFQKNVIELHKRFPDKVDLLRVYFHNTYLSEEDLKYIAGKIKGVGGEALYNAMNIDDDTPQMAVERLLLLSKLNKEEE